MKRGKKLKTPNVFETLAECLKHTALQPESNIPYETTIAGKTLYIWASSPSNAVKFASYFIGAHASPVKVTDIIKTALPQLELPLTPNP